MPADIVFTKSVGYPLVFISPSQGYHLDNVAISAIDTETSYAVKDIEWIRRAGRGKDWDGKVHLLRKTKKGTYFFPIGLLKRVEKVLDYMGITYEERLKFLDTGQDCNWEWTGPQLRNYQIDAFIRAKKEERCITQLPTGSGKTILALKLVAALSKPTLVIVHTKELFDQWLRNISENTNIEPTEFNDKSKEFGTMTVAMVQSLDRWIKKDGNSLPAFDVFVCDEVHHMPCNTFYSVAMKCDARYRFGFTATTNREDGADLMMIAGIGPITTSVKPEDLIGSSFLAKPRFKFLSVPPYPIKGFTYREVYKNGIVYNPERNMLIVETARKLAESGRQVYIHVEEIAHGKLLSSMSGFDFVYSQSKNRSEVIDKFRRGETKVLISTLLGEGVDIPNISAIIMAGGRKTEIGTIQKIGRALRPTNDGRDAIVVDFIDKGRYISDHAMARAQAYVKFFGEYALE